MRPTQPSRTPSPAELREAQGRLFWTWLFALPILLILGASLHFGAPWPTPLLHDLAMLALAFPVIFVVGLPLFHLDELDESGQAAEAHDAAEPPEPRGPRDARFAGQGILLLDRLVAGVASLGYLSGLTALAGWNPGGAGLSAVLAATYLTARHRWGRTPPGS